MSEPEDSAPMDAPWRSSLLGQLRTLSPYDFEQYVAKLFRSEGYEAEVTPRSGDGGRDIRIERDGWHWVVECKRYDESTAVGRRDIQVLHSVVVSERASGGIVVTTGRFTQQARDYAAENGVRLVGPRQLARMHRRVHGSGEGWSLMGQERGPVAPTAAVRKQDVRSQTVWQGVDYIDGRAQADDVIWSADGTTFIAGGVWVRLNASGEIESVQPGSGHALSRDGSRSAMAYEDYAAVFERGHQKALIEVIPTDEEEISYEYYNNDVAIMADPYGLDQNYTFGPVAISPDGRALIVGRTAGISVSNDVGYDEDRPCSGTFEVFAVDAPPLRPEGARWIQGIDRWVSRSEAETHLQPITPFLNTPCVAKWQLDPPFHLRHDGRLGVILYPEAAELFQATAVGISPGGTWLGMAGTVADSWKGFYLRLEEEWADDDEGFSRALSRTNALVVAPLNGRSPHLVETYGETIVSFGFSPDDRLVAVGLGDGSVVLWDPRVAASLWRADVGMEILSFGFQGEAVYVAGQRGLVAGLGLGTGETISSWSAPGLDVETAALSPDSRRLVTAHGDGRLRIWTRP